MFRKLFNFRFKEFKGYGVNLVVSLSVKNIAGTKIEHILDENKNLELTGILEDDLAIWSVKGSSLIKIFRIYQSKTDVINEIISLTEIFLEKTNNSDILTSMIFSILGKRVLEDKSLKLNKDLNKLFYDLLQNAENYLGLERELGGRENIEYLTGQL